MELSKSTLLQLKKDFGEAFYLLDSAQFRRNYLELKKAFSSIYSNFNIAYSYKTNYAPKICKIVNELGGYAEVVSEMEVELASRIGVETNNIIWNGPIKNKSKLESFLLSGGIVNVDSIDEGIYICKLAEKYPKNTFNIGIRCNYDVKDKVVSRFGFDIESQEFYEMLDLTRYQKNMYLINLQCHFAKRELEYWSEKTKGMLDLIAKLEIIPDRIDLGGGLFGKMEASLKKQFHCQIPTYEDYAYEIATLFATKFGNMKKKPQLIIEPGSALVGDCMQFVGTVKTIKKVRGKYFATVLGSQKNISMTGVNPPLKVIKMLNNQDDYQDLDFVGFTCIESDVIYRNYCGKLAVDDVIVISNCGSYSIVMKPPFILPNFPVLDISNKRVEVIKQAETFDDIFHTYKL